MIWTQLLGAVVVTLVVCTQVGAEGDPPPRTLAPIRPKATFRPIIPREAAPDCTRPLAKVTVPPGATLTFSYPSAARLETRARKAICGWVFKTDVGETLTFSCQSYSLSRRDKMVLTQRGATRKVFRFGGNGGSFNMELPTNLANVAFRHSAAGTRSFFSCEVTASGGEGVGPVTDSVPDTTVAPNPAPPATDGCRCGIVNRASRIVGGSTTEVNEYPWQVGLIYTNDKSVFCGGTLISDRHVLTAAHCTPGLTTRNFRLLLGGHSIRSSSATEFIVSPVNIMDNPTYRESTMNNDMSVIEIPPINFDDPNIAVRPICLPDSDESYTGTLATVSGWGTLESDGNQPTLLQEVQVPVVSNAACRRVYGPSITDNMLCAGTDEGGKDSCQGDSGGPLTALDGANHELIGVVSFGSGCGDPGVPGVYARVTTLQSWIDSKTGGSSTCGR